MARYLFAEAGCTLPDATSHMDGNALQLSLSYQAACCDLLKHTSAFICIMVADQRDLVYVLTDFGQRINNNNNNNNNCC